MTHTLKISLFAAFISLAAVSCNKENDDVKPIPSTPQLPVNGDVCRTTKITTGNQITTFTYNNQKQLTTARTVFGTYNSEARFEMNNEGKVIRIADYTNNQLFNVRVFEYENGRIKTEKQLNNQNEVMTTYRYEYAGTKLIKKTLYSKLATGGEEVESGYTLFEIDSAGEITKATIYVPKKDGFNGEYVVSSIMEYGYSNKPATLAYNYHTYTDAEYFANKKMLSSMTVIMIIDGVQDENRYTQEHTETNAKSYVLKSIMKSESANERTNITYEYACD